MLNGDGNDGSGHNSAGKRCCKGGWWWIAVLRGCNGDCGGHQGERWEAAMRDRSDQLLDIGMSIGEGGVYLGGEWANKSTIIK